MLVAALAPGESHAIVVTPAVARRLRSPVTTAAACRIGWDDQAPPVDGRGAIGRGGGRRAAASGSTYVCVPPAKAPVQALRVRPRSHAAAVYVAGSTTVNGHAVVDGIEGPPLFTRDGLALHDIPAGTFVEIGWSLLAAHARRIGRRGRPRCQRRRRSTSRRLACASPTRRRSARAPARCRSTSTPRPSETSAPPAPPPGDAAVDPISGLRARRSGALSIVCRSRARLRLPMRHRRAATEPDPRARRSALGADSARPARRARPRADRPLAGARGLLPDPGRER